MGRAARHWPEAFTRKYDPYHDIPLVETLPAGDRPQAAAVRKDTRDRDLPRDLFGDPLPTNLFGEVIDPNNKKKRR
ncbi:MAG: hypothetical protein IPK52_12710 [Chloroflexi bacterium]|nr:hypothetical protein [Chloroflexota bacterium]